MRLPRDVGADDLIHRLGRLGYRVTRQSGSHLRLTRLTRLSAEGQQHLTIPRHNPLKVGTLSEVLSLAAQQLRIEKQDLIAQLF